MLKEWKGYPGTITICISNKGSYPEHTKNFHNFIRKSLKPYDDNMKKKKPTKQFTKENIRIANLHMKRCSTPLVIREMQSKITVRHH